jgi:methylase of polypeptide subunit release factors
MTSPISTIREHQQAFLQQVKERTQPTPYLIEGVSILVNPHVFPPATDTKLLCRHIHTNTQHRTLDLTSGAGTASIIAGLQGATGIAVDINPDAVKNSTDNFALHHVHVTAIESNLYTNIPKEQFDLVFANGPFFEGDITDPLDYACYGARAFIEGVFAGLKGYMKPEGKLLIVLSAWADLDHFMKTATDSGCVAVLTDTQKSEDGKRTYNLYEVTIH